MKETTKDRKCTKEQRQNGVTTKNLTTQQHNNGTTQQLRSERPRISRVARMTGQQLPSDERGWCI